MSKIESPKLFELIKSMTKAEKRMFKLSSMTYNNGEDGVYMKLFNAIEAQEVYDEEQIKKEFGKAEFVKHFSTLKVQLYQLVLKSMEGGHNTIDNTLRSYIHQIEILYEKTLFKHCEDILVKAKEYARRYEKFLALSDLLKWEKKLLMSTLFKGEGEQKLNINKEETKDAVKKYKNLTEYEDLLCEITVLRVKFGFIRTANELKRYKRILKQKLLMKEEFALSYGAKYLFYQCHSLYCSAIVDHEKGYALTKKIMQILDSEPYRSPEAIVQKSAMMRNLIASAHYLGKYDEMHDYIVQLTNFDFKFRKSEIEAFLNARSFELMLYNQTGQYQMGIDLIEKVKSDFENETILAQDSKMYFYFAAAQIFLGSKKYQMANKYLNKILNENISVRSDIYCHAKILGLIINYESGNDSSMEYAIKSTYRLLFKRGRLYKYESTLLDFIRKKMSKLDTTKKQIEAFGELKAKIEHNIKDPFERRALIYFDLISWLESKITNVPFDVILRRKAEIKIS